jgi:transposase
LAFLVDNEAFDGCLHLDERAKHTPSRPSFCEFGEKARDGVEPEGGGAREVEGEAAGEPGVNVAQKRGLNRAIVDAAWRRLIDLIRDKAVKAGGGVVTRDARRSSG